jgi:hypothetical protein
MARHRVDWTPEERDRVIEKVLKLYLTEPEYSVTQLFNEAQLAADLPENRRRPIAAFSAAKDVVAALKQRLLELWDLHRAGNRAAADGSKAEITKLTSERDTALARVAELEDELAKYHDQPPAPTIDSVLAGATTQQLFFLTMTRMLQSIAGERETMEKNIGKAMATYVSGERHAVEQQLHNLTSAINGLTKNGHLPQAPALPLADEFNYMPQFTVAGLARGEFQRLQGSLIKANVRLMRLDITTPSKIPGIPAETDRFVVWSGPGSSLPQDLAPTLQNKFKFTLNCNGSINDLQSLIIREAAAIRETHKGSPAKSA